MPATIIAMRLVKVVLLSGFLGLLSACSSQPQATVEAAQIQKLDSQVQTPELKLDSRIQTTEIKPGLTNQKTPELPTRDRSLGVQVVRAASAGIAATSAVSPSQKAAAAPQAARAASAPPKPAADGLPPISYICIMPGDEAVLEDKPGKCPNPKCGMDLKPIRIVQAWSCLNNTAFIQDTPGKCITDKTDLVPISASMFWACPATPDKHELNPVKCADGTPAVRKYEVRPHGDHNPRHGGSLFMAPDLWHHLEGTYPSAGLFRVFFYNDWTKPLAPTGFTARAVVKDAAGKDVATIPLKAGRISNAMEAQIPGAALPLTLQLLVSFKAGERDQPFDFQFPTYSKEPAVPVATTTVNAPASGPAPAASRGAVAGQAAPRSAAATPAAQGRGTAPTQGRGAAPAGRGRGAAPAGETPSRPAAPKTPSPSTVMAGDPPTQPNVLEFMPPIIPQEDPIPATSKEILAEMAVKSHELETDLTEGVALGQLWVPALRTKNLALALVNDHLNELPTQQRVIAENAANRLVRAAWAIDNLGDLGDKEKILAVHVVFAAAVSDLRGAYASVR